MASTIAAITTGIGGIVTTADATGNLSLLSGTSTVVAVTSAGAAVTGTMSVSGATTLTGGLNTPLAVTSGGTGLGTLTANNVILGAGTSNPTFVAPSTTGNLLTSNGTTWTSAAAPASGVTTFNGSTTGLTPATATSGAITLGGTLAVANGGTGVTTSTGTGANVLGTSPTLTTPVINGFTGDTSVINIGSGQVYKDASGNVGIGTASPITNLTIYNGNIPSSTYIPLLIKGGGAGTANDGGGIAFSTALSSAITSVSQSASAIRSLNGYASESNGEEGSLAFYTNRRTGVNTYTGLTEAMRIDPSGNVGIGTSSPSSKLDIFTSSNYGSQLPITLSANNSASVKTNYTQIGFVIAQSAAGSETGGFELKSLRNNTSVYLADYEGAAGSAKWRFYTEGSERMRIDSSGNVGIGTSINSVYDGVAQPRPLVVQSASTATGQYNSTNALVICNSDTTANNASQLNFAAITGASTNQYTSAAISCIYGARTNTIYPSGILTFATSPATQAPLERMRIDSSGSLLVGTTSKIVNAAVTIVGTTGGLGLISGRQTTNTAGKYFNWGTSTDANPYWIVYNESNVGVYLAPGGNTWTSGSDETIKENLKPIENSLNSVLSLRTVIGNYTTDPEKVKHPFLIAQDVQKVLPEAVSIGPDGKLGLQYTDTIPLLTAAIQELKAIIDTQATRITALEAK